MHQDPARGTRWQITALLVVGGALVGALVGLALTVLGKIVAGAPPATAANHLWNATAFAVLGALLAPTVTWASLRHVALWRALVEPLAGAVLGAAVGVLLGSGIVFLLLAPIGAVLALVRLGRAASTARPRLPGAAATASRDA